MFQKVKRAKKKKVRESHKVTVTKAQEMWCHSETRLLFDSATLLLSLSPSYTETGNANNSQPSTRFILNGFLKLESDLTVLLDVARGKTRKLTQLQRL